MNDWWIQTYTGKRGGPGMEIEDISIIDIAHALSNICRFNGHATSFYSVAQHSVLASLHHKGTKWLLLHDAHEAYMGDITSPLKRALGAPVSETEIRLQRKINQRFMGPGKENPAAEIADIIRDVDLCMLNTERENLFDHAMDWSLPSNAKYSMNISPWTPTRSRFEFLLRFCYLFPEFEAEVADMRDAWRAAALAEATPTSARASKRFSLLLMDGDGKVLNSLSFDDEQQARAAVNNDERCRAHLNTGGRIELTAPTCRFENRLIDTDLTIRPSDALRAIYDESSISERIRRARYVAPCESFGCNQ